MKRIVRLPWGAIAALLFVLNCGFVLSANAKVIYVNKNALGPPQDGLSWATAFTKVQDAIGAAESGDEVWVASSMPAARAYDESLLIYFPLSVYGGFSGTETQREQRNPRANVTVIQAVENRHVVTITTAVTLPATVDGFTLLNSGTGGVYTVGIAVISNNVIMPGPILSGFAVSGGIAVWGGVATIANNTISGNRTAQYRGGGIYVGQAIATITDNVVSGNYAWDGGGGIYTGSYRDVVISGNLITDNRSGSGGGILTEGPVTITNNTVCRNTSPQGAGVYIGSENQRFVIAMENNIVVFNDTGVLWTKGTVVASGNDVYGNSKGNYVGIADPTGANGNISRDPLFVNRAAGDYHLRLRSPCIDAGDDSVVTPGETDLDGSPRIKRAHVDMGCYEFPSYSKPPITEFGGDFTRDMMY